MNLDETRAYAQIERLLRALDDAQAREVRLRGALVDLIDGFEGAVDTRRCTVSVLRTLNKARAALDGKDKP